VDSAICPACRVSCERDTRSHSIARQKFAAREPTEAPIPAAYRAKRDSGVDVIDADLSLD